MKQLKNTLLTWGIAYLLITGLLYALNSWLAPYPIYLKTLVLSGLMVFAMNYFIFPGLKRIRINKNQ